jgi:dTDP-glucose 4,6-dehydratase
MPALPAADISHIFEHEIDWNQLWLENIFVTGGTGFFGRWILESFAYANFNLALGATMTVLTRDPDAARAKAPELAANPAIHFIRGDVRYFDREAVLEQLPKDHPGDFRFVIHAGTAPGAPLTPLEMLETITLGTRRALDFAVAAGTKKFLLTGSGAVYGRQPPEMTHVPESYAGAPDPTDPHAAYGEGKRVAELLCAAYHKDYGIETKIARCFAFVGPFLPLDAHFAIGNFIRDALRGGPIRIGGDGTPRRSYLHAADLAIWLWTLLFRGQPGRPYNVGSEDDVTILELASIVAECFPNQIDVELARQPVPNLPCSRYVPATGRAAGELGLATLIPLKEAISRTAAWHANFP